MSGLVKVYEKHPVSTDGGSRYPQACRFPDLKHHLHFFSQKMRKALLKEQCNTVYQRQNQRILR